MSDGVSRRGVESVMHSLFLKVYAVFGQGEVLLAKGKFEALSEEEKICVLTGIDPENTVKCLKGFPSERMDVESVINRGCTPWQLLLRGMDFVDPDLRSPWEKFTGPCPTCKPLSQLCNLAIQSGCNVARCIDVLARNTIPNDSSYFRYKLVDDRRKRLCAAQQRISNDCCFLTVLKVLLTNDVDITPLLQLDLPNVCTPALMQTISNQDSEFGGYVFNCRFKVAPSLTEMKKICHAFILYYPGCTENIITSLLWSTHPGADELWEIVQKLHEMLLTPRSLKFLAKRSILRAVQRKQVYSLPLPNLLKAYILEDETEERPIM